MTWHYYGTKESGSRTTWHDSQELDIEVDDLGQVVAVWFRCMALPFQVTEVDDQRADDMNRLFYGGEHGVPDLLGVAVDLP